MPTANLTTGMKVCSRNNCKHKGVQQPVTNFAKCRRNKDGLQEACKDCARLRGCKNPQEAKGNLDLARTNLLANVFTGANRTSTRTEQFVESGIKHAGGVEALAESYFRTLADPEMKPHNKIRAYQGFFNIMADNDRMNPVRMDVSQATEEELKEWLRQIVHEESRKNENEIVLPAADYRITG